MAKQQMTGVQKAILAVVLVPVFMSLLSISSINVILPSVQESLDASNTAIQWVLSGYTLAFGVLLVAGGRAGDTFGRGKLFVAGLVLFGLGSLLAGFALNGPMLVAARLLTGFGSGLLNPQTVGFIQQFFDGPLRARAFASFGSVVGVSVAIGPVLGGGLIALAGPDWGWRWTFLVNVPIAVLAIIVAYRTFPKAAWVRHVPEGASAEPGKPDLDPVGTVAFTLGTLLVMWTFLEIDAGGIYWAMLPVGIAILFWWVWWERRYKRRGGAPMVDMALFRNRPYRNGSLLISLFFTGSTSVWVTVAIFLQTGHGISALTAALVGVPSAIATTISSQIAGRYVLAAGRAMVAWGMSVTLLALSSSMLVIIGVQLWDWSIWWLIATLSLLGVAQGFIVSPNQTLSLIEVPAHVSGVAGAVMQTGQRVGTSVGTAIITSTLFGVAAAYSWNWAFISAFGIIMLLVGIAMTVAIIDIRGTRGTQTAVPQGREAQ
ncbi:MAG TPA: MFS transporter [Enteractinococcus helveticum]|uniref:MFS transporter n=1 Tax=Enteractinococcus helveticum TaxID=1837282 RepID=A0A921FN68_9MICC|nr:MFS transporter [Enteractinococcus helveticum]HJF14027.1 MFS transporter [Enteractinococcus helveticum]